MATATTKVKAFVDLVERRKGLKVIVCVTPRVYKFFWWALDFILYIIACRRNMCILNQVEKKKKARSSAYIPGVPTSFGKAFSKKTSNYRKRRKNSWKFVCLHSRYPFNLTIFFDKKYPYSDFARFVDFTKAFHLKLVGTHRMYYFKSVNPAPSARMSCIFMAT